MIAKRYFRMIIPFVIVSYLANTIVDYLSYPTLLIYDYKSNGGSSELFLNTLFLEFLPNYFFAFNVFGTTIQSMKGMAFQRFIGSWYIREDFLFCLLTPFVLMVYLKSAKVFYISVVLSLLAYQVYAVFYTCSFPNFNIPSNLIKMSSAHVQNF